MPQNAAFSYILKTLKRFTRCRVLMLPHDTIDMPKKILDNLFEANGDYAKDAVDVIASFYNRQQWRDEPIDEYVVTHWHLQAKANSLQNYAVSSTHLAALFVK